MIELTVLAAAYTPMVQALTERFVVNDNPTALSPYTNWTDAAANVQDAISACSSGDVVWVTNGTYNTGGVTNCPAGTVLTNRVAITNAITVRSVNGPALTTIKGRWDPGTTNGPAAVRCVYMAQNTSLIGFTVTNGATLTGPTDDSDRFGGGIFCAGASTYALTYTTTVISNCVISGNSAGKRGSGTLRGVLYNCAIAGNILSFRGGGVHYAIICNSTLRGNQSTDCGGGAQQSSVSNCMLTGNVSGYGAAACQCSLYNCTMVGNSCGWGLAGYCTLYNCIEWGNLYTLGADVSTWYYSCGPNALYYTNGVGSITNNPKFVADGAGYGTNHVAGNYRLQINSPCVNTGTNQAWMTTAYDLDGRPRIRYGRVDMGAYEFLRSGTVYTFR